jgi:hypothetical protein
MTDYEHGKLYVYDATSQTFDPHVPREELWECSGCGTRKSMEQIKAEHPGALSCCPERKMMPEEQT